MPLSDSSLERLVPNELSESGVTGRRTLGLHIERYRFAARHAAPGRALDIACGVGYGTRLLADESPGLSSCLGVDLSPDAVRYAEAHYARSGVCFAQGDALGFRDAEGFDTIVSLETVEHVSDPQVLIDNLTQMLRPGGVLVASAPTTPSVDVNPYHLHDFTARSFRRMLRGHPLRERACLLQVQAVSPSAVLRRGEERLRDRRPHLLRYYARHPEACLKRAWSTLRYGFENRYLTIAWQRCA